jgi:glycosyltransferase involved in cell wall biosynthesis
MENEKQTGNQTTGKNGFEPVLGLSDQMEAPSAHWGTVYDQPEPDELLELTVIVPARNVEPRLAACLESLVSQSEETFELGLDWELIVVDDHSSDRTAEIARGFAGVTVTEAGKLEPGWTSKNNALWTGAKRARGRWLLFTEAEALHEPGNLNRALHEATRHKAGLLSYSPRQMVDGLWQRSLLPLIFCELELAYPSAKVSDAGQRIAAANSKFLLFEREAYRRVGGHASVAESEIEDLELAALAKRRKIGLRFRYADDALSTRSCRSTTEMIEDWTRKLPLLFDNCLALAFWRLIDIVLLVALPVLAIEFWNAPLFAHSAQWLIAGWILALVWVRTLFRFYGRVAKSHFSFADCILAPLGLPLFVALLCRGWSQHRTLKRVN